jgi:2-polyprenyl-6-hydroxyphenyl methylase/3-demethylubiquinone-9 3-methyltransferase
LRAAEMTGMTYNPFTRRYRLGPDTSVNYLLACVKDA